MYTRKLTLRERVSYWLIQHLESYCEGISEREWRKFEDRRLKQG